MSSFGLILVLLCAGNPAGGQAGNNAVKSILMVVPPKEIQNDEFFKSKSVFDQNGFKVVIAGLTTNIATTDAGLNVKPELALENVNTDHYDALAIIGGMGTVNFLFGNEALLNIVKDFYNKKKLTTCICGSAVIFARAGILKGRKATVYAYDPFIEELKKNGAIVDPSQVVISDHVITAKDYTASVEYAEAVSKALKAK
jgi:protease I